MANPEHLKILKQGLFAELIGRSTRPARVPPCGTKELSPALSAGRAAVRNKSAVGTADVVVEFSRSSLRDSGHYWKPTQP
jgi:hypothetical protein